MRCSPDGFHFSSWDNICSLPESPAVSAYYPKVLGDLLVEEDNEDGWDQKHHQEVDDTVDKGDISYTNRWNGTRYFPQY